MKNVLMFVLILFSLTAYGQRFKLFKENSEKLFIHQSMIGNTYGISFDSVIYYGTDSVYHNYNGVENEYFSSDSCTFYMGGNNCFKQEKSKWIGPKIIFDNGSQYTFFTNQNNGLTFNFGINAGDSVSFYKDSIQSFYILNQGIDTITCIDYLDSANFFQIHHFDSNGTFIDSELNLEYIIIGKSIGLINFLKIDSFPEVECPVTLIGNSNPTIGFTEITNEILHDYIPGDEIQYWDKYSNEGGPPWFNYSKYIKYKYIERSDTEDSIFYLIEKTTINLDSQIIDTVLTSYNSKALLARIPFDKITNYNHPLISSSLQISTICYENYWSYRLKPKNLTYCEIDNCWGSYNITGGPPPNILNIYACGLGLYYYRNSLFLPPPDGYDHFIKIIYFKKNGIECGEEVLVDIKEKESKSISLHIYPNPASNKITFEIENIQALLRCYDVNGRLAYTGNIKDSHSIDISTWRAGMYVAVTSSEGKVGRSLFVVK